MGEHRWSDLGPPSICFRPVNWSWLELMLCRFNGAGFISRYRHPLRRSGGIEQHQCLDCRRVYWRHSLHTPSTDKELDDGQ